MLEKWLPSFACPAAFFGNFSEVYWRNATGGPTAPRRRWAPHDHL